MTTLLVLMAACLVALSWAGITGFASRMKELQQTAANLDKEEAELREEMAGIFQAARGSKGKKLTEEQEKRKGEIEARLAEIDQLRSFNDEELLNESKALELERRQAGRGVEVGRELILDKPMSDGEFYQRVAVAFGADIPSVGRRGFIDPRLMAGPSGSSTQPSESGFSIGKDRVTSLMAGIEAASVILPMCDNYEVSEGNDGIEAAYVRNTSRATGSRFGGVRVYRRKEAATVEASQVQWAMFELRLEDQMALAYCTERQLQDARLSADILNRAVTAEFAFVTDDEIVRGVGAGQMTGWLNAPCLVTVDAEDGQVADSIVSPNISNMWNALPVGMRSKAAWFYNGELDPWLDKLYLAAGVGALEPRFVSYGPDGLVRIKGRPIYAIEQASAPGDLGDFMLAVPSEFATVTKGGTQADDSIHVRYLYAERTFRWIRRINGKSKWESAVAPYKGSVSKSPIIALAAR